MVQWKKPSRDKFFQQKIPRFWSRFMFNISVTGLIIISYNKATSGLLFQSLIMI